MAKKVKDISAPIDGLAKHIVGSLEEGPLTTAKMKKILEAWYSNPLTTKPKQKVMIKIPDPHKRYLVADINGREYYEPVYLLTKEEKKDVSIVDPERIVKNFKETLLGRPVGIYLNKPREDIAVWDLLVENIDLLAKKPASDYLKSDRLLSSLFSIGELTFGDMLIDMERPIKEDNPTKATFIYKEEKILGSSIPIRKQQSYDYQDYEFSIKRLSKNKYEFIGNQKIIPLLEEELRTKFTVIT